MSARDPGPALLRAIVADAAAVGLALADVTIDAAEWASATFVGHRHRIGFTVAGPEAAAWLARLPEAEWRLTGHIVADLAVDRHEAGTVVLAALTLHDG